MLASAQAWLKKPKSQYLIIFLLGLLVYSNTFYAPFIFDDDFVIIENRNLDNVVTFFRSIQWLSFGYKSRWVSLATFAFNKSIGGVNVIGYHVINLLIHIATGFVIYFLSKTVIEFQVKNSIDKYLFVPFLSALGFVIHPIQTQSVTYIVQRMTSLATLLYLTTLLLYVTAVSPALANKQFKRKLLYLLAMAACILAMSTKEISFTLPFTIILFDFCFLEGSWRQRIFRILPFCICMAGLSFYLQGMHRGLQILTDGVVDNYVKALSRDAYLFTEFRVIITYIRLLILPVGQRFDYDYPEYSSIWHPQVLCSLAVLVMLLGYGIYLLKRSFDRGCQLPVLHRITGIAIIWFFITLSVESGLAPVADVINEHRLYLPSVWLFVALGVLVVELYSRRLVSPKIILIAVMILFSSFGYATFQRNRIWSDKLTMWIDTVNKAPNKARCWVGLGNYYVTRLEAANAIQVLQHAITLSPTNYMAHLYLGMALLQQGQEERALSHYLTVTRLAPQYLDGWEHAGLLYYRLGLNDESDRCFRRYSELSRNANDRKL